MLRLVSSLCLVVLFACVGPTTALRAQTAPDQIRLTKIFGYQQTGSAALAAYLPSVEALASYRFNVSATWGLSMSSSTGAGFALIRDAQTSVLETSFSGSQSFQSIEDLNQRIANGTFSTYIAFGTSAATAFVFPVTFDNGLPTTTFDEFDALQSWDGEARTISWQTIAAPPTDETRVFTLERANGTVVFDTRVDGVPLDHGSVSVAIPKVTSALGEIFYATLTYTRLRNATVISTGSFVSLYQSFRVRMPVKRTPPPAPVITTHPASISAQIGASLTFNVVAAGEGLTYAWMKNGLALFGTTTATLALSSISANSAAAYTVTVTNAGGSVTSNPAILTIAAAPTAPAITTFSVSQTVNAGSAVTLRATHTGTAPFVYQWLRDGTLVSGATNLELTFDPVTPADAGSYTLRITNSVGTVTSAASALAVRPIAPGITSSPTSLTVLAGARATLGVTTTGTAPFTYQWLRDGTPLSGATTATLNLDPAHPSDAASYRVTVANSSGSVTSAAATLTVTPIGRISNLSVLTSLSGPADTFTLGYVLGGNATAGLKPLVLRAAGPALGALGVGGTLDDPKLELFAGSAKTAENDNWGTTAPVATALTTAFTAVGAFPFASPNSRDAALAVSLTTRDNSVKISAANAGTGLVIAEIYDATPSASFISTTPRLLNVSVLKSLGTGLTVGFTVAGSTPKTVLIRAIGPTLGNFGVPGTVADPQLALFASGATLPFATNDNWDGDPALTTAFSGVGAFTLPPTSKDAALLATLPPGGYSVQVSGVANTTGTALVEVYEVP